MSHAPVFLTFIVVVITARLFGFVARRLGQPPVMGEVLGGLVLGPSAFGYLWPAGTDFFFHPEALVFLRNVAEIGISLYLFLMGLELDLVRLRQGARSALAVSALSIAVPFGLGVLLADGLHDAYAPAGLGRFEFALFIAVSLSITAFPVLARILSDSPLRRTRLGDLALTCAALDDVTAWCLVAVVTGITTGSSPLGAWMTLALTVGYVGVMVGLVRPALTTFLPRIERRWERLPEGPMAFAILGALASATFTHVIGIHALFGAFLFGAVIPHDSLVARGVGERLQDFVRIMFLPAFFALTGLKTQLGLLSSPRDWLVCGLITALAVLGKFGGAFAGARLSGNDRLDSVILGILMNTRGLVELIVLNIGLSLGVLTPTLFAMLVVMALVTTFMTGPLLRVACRSRL